MNEEREKVYQILELVKHIKNLHHKKGFGGLLFIDLSMIKFSKLSSYIRQLDKENQELKKQLENCYCNRTDCSGRIKDSKKYDSLIQAQEVQQKEFIKFLENELLDARYYARDIAHYIEYVLQRYKEITQTKNDKSV